MRGREDSPAFSFLWSARARRTRGARRGRGRRWARRGGAPGPEGKQSTARPSRWTMPPEYIPTTGRPDAVQGGELQHRLRPRRYSGSATRSERKNSHLASGERLRERHALRNEGHAAAGGVGWQAVRIPGDRRVVGRTAARRRFERGRVAGTVRADEGDGFPRAIWT